MDDKAILDLYWSRSESAISETDTKYGAYCFCIANNILNNREDSQESVNDTYLAAWNTIPPKRPAVLAAFLGKITRYISLDLWKKRSRLKRGRRRNRIVSGRTQRLRFRSRKYGIFCNSQRNRYCHKPIFIHTSGNGTEGISLPVLVFRLCKRHCQTLWLLP